MDGETDDTVPLHPRGADDATEPQLAADYEYGSVIGRGGMGEIVGARDRRIGRDVAIKRMRDAEPEPALVDRFLREARLQARLDHPAIPPVYELGRDAKGRPYFAMKRLSGVTLAAKLKMRGSTQPMLPAFAQPLLRAFAEVCRAIAFAHARDVIHRDLKPANIMLGEYGEVYVLDWGLARTVGEARERPDTSDELALNLTDTHQMLGTIGYMPPEQILDSASVGPPADVYALGAILFEILCGEPAHPRGPQAIATTHAGILSTPAQRRDDVPPELDAICVAALSRDPAQRPTAFALATAVQDYLDGDRDTARRKTLAAEALYDAHVAFAHERRAEAMRAAGRAMALDAASGGAELVTRLMLEPPREIPAGLHDAWRAEDAEAVRRHAASSLVGFGGVLLMLPVAIWNGVLSWPIVLGITGIGLALALYTIAILRQPDRRPRDLYALMFGAATMIPLADRLFSPFILAPAVACLFAWASAMYPQLLRHFWSVVTVIVASWLVPPLLEYLGYLPASWSVSEGAITITSDALRIGGARTGALVLAVNLFVVLVGAYHGFMLARASHHAHRKLVSQAWHLQQLLPG
ncbi:MAG TPA: serine/threonine-protein kinase [Kofleriaceae bacterium]|nr:serine/threonine-protein kinase [Kofleriaceae bacterium]